MRPRPQIEDACQGTREKLAYQLQQQREELAHLSRVTTLGELATTLAHELNHPLARSVAMPKRRESPAKKNATLLEFEGASRLVDLGEQSGTLCLLCI